MDTNNSQKAFLELLTTPRRRSFRSTLIHGIGVVFFSTLFTLQLHGVPEPEMATEVLMASGYTNITLGGSKWLACGGDIFSTYFTATTPYGTKVSGYVCGTLLSRSSTIRFTVTKP